MHSPQIGARRSITPDRRRANAIQTSVPRRCLWWDALARSRGAPVEDRSTSTVGPTRRRRVQHAGTEGSVVRRHTKRRVNPIHDDRQSSSPGRASSRARGETLRRLGQRAVCRDVQHEATQTIQRLATVSGNVLSDCGGTRPLRHEGWAAIHTGWGRPGIHGARESGDERPPLTRRATGSLSLEYGFA